jgi:hypothetical protein
MAIYIDEPRETNFKNYTYTAHLLSDDGREELLAFGHDLAMKEKWLHNPGTPKEHFDLFDAWIGFALMEGAHRISRERFVGIIREKRHCNRNRSSD